MSKNKDLHQKVIWITGASSGIGEGLAYAMAQQGACLILSARRLSELERVKAACNNPHQHVCVELDLMHSSEFEALTEKLWNEMGGIDLLVNNAGISQRDWVMNTSMDVHRKIMEINYFGSVALTQALLPHMLERAKQETVSQDIFNGGVITISSLVGKFTTPLRSAYSASKHAITAYMDSLRVELADSGLQFTTIYPGFIKTNLTYQALLGDGSAQNKMDHAQENGMSPDECAKRIITAYQQGKAEAYIGGRETNAVYLKRFFPRLFERIVRKAKVT
ncbi:MAG: SDR family oxidoreductase [Kangiellaceae bacterium]|nr:SDR family oxidoreductase [Kangiellaceae bacterium]